MKKKRQFLTIRHTEKIILKHDKTKKTGGKRSSGEPRAAKESAACSPSPCLPRETVGCRYQVPSTPPTDKSRRVRSYIWARTNNGESCPKASVAPAWCFPVISIAKGRKMWWSCACILCLLNCYCSFKLCLSYTTPYFTCQNGGGIRLASRSSLSNMGMVDCISGQQKATLGTMARHSLSDCVD